MFPLDSALQGAFGFFFLSETNKRVVPLCETQRESRAKAPEASGIVEEGVQTAADRHASLGLSLSLFVFASRRLSGACFSAANASRAQIHRPCEAWGPSWREEKAARATGRRWRKNKDIGGESGLGLRTELLCSFRLTLQNQVERLFARALLSSLRRTQRQREPSLAWTTYRIEFLEREKEQAKRLECLCFFFFPFGRDL